MHGERLPAGAARVDQRPPVTSTIEPVVYEDVSPSSHRTADEVAAAILWLLGDTSSYTTGSIVEVTGGR